jgi:hypothetical protein
MSEILKYQKHEIINHHISCGKELLADYKNFYESPHPIHPLKSIVIIRCLSCCHDKRIAIPISLFVVAGWRFTPLILLFKQLGLAVQFIYGENPVIKAVLM